MTVTATTPSTADEVAAARPVVDDSGEPRWLDADQQQAWRSYLEGSLRLAEALNRDLEAAKDLSLNEYEVLVRLSESPDRTMRMAALAESLAHSRSRLTHTVRRMSERGLVERNTCTVDGRGVNCTMTQRGYDVLVDAAPRHVSAVRAFLVDRLTPEEFAVLGRAMAKVVDACRDA